MHYILEFLKSIYLYIVEIFPYLLTANVIASFLDIYMDIRWISNITKNTLKGTLISAVLGGMLPFCSCSTIPLVNLINSQSKSYAPAISFIVMASVVSPVSVFLTYGLFGLKMSVFRLLGAFLFAIIFAIIVDKVFKKPKTLPMKISYNKSEKNLKVFLSNIKTQFLSVGKYILIGIFIASVIKVLIPKAIIEHVYYKPLSYPIMSILGLAFYVCSGEEVPIAHAINKIGFSQGDALTFMFSSTGICIPTLMSITKFLPKRIIYVYVLSWIIFSITMGIIYDAFLTSSAHTENLHQKIIPHFYFSIP